MSRNLQYIGQRLHQNHSPSKDYLSTEQLSVYMEISDPDKIQPSCNDGGLCEAPYDIQRIELPSAAHYTHQVTYRAYPNEASFRAHPLNSRRQQHDRYQYVFP